jgi:hypothetical protein
VSTWGLVNRDADGERGAAIGARRALAAIGHELSSPLTALSTYLRLAKGEGLAPIGACVQRIQAIAEVARELAFLDEASIDTSETVDIGLAIDSAVARLGLTVTVEMPGELRVAAGAKRAVAIIVAGLRAVASTAPAALVVRVERRADRICVRIGQGAEPAAWRVIDPWRSGTGFKLDLWAAAVAAGDDGVVRVGDVEGQIAVEVELAVAESR